MAIVHFLRGIALMASGLREVLVDVCVVIDATVTPGPIREAILEYVVDIVWGWRQPGVRQRFACVLYRNPAPGNDEPENHLKKHEVCDFTTKGEFFEFLDSVEFCSGRQGPTDWADALELALSGLSWRDEKKIIVWISCSNAHGTRFSTPEENDPNPEEEGRLVKLFDEAASRNIVFAGINAGWDDDQSGCRKTLWEIREIYEKVGLRTSALLFEICRDWDYDFDDFSIIIGSKPRHGTRGIDILRYLMESI